MDLSPNSFLRKYLCQDFVQPKYDSFRKWYFANHNKEQLQKIKTLYYSSLQATKTLESFPKWYYQYVKFYNFLQTEDQLNVLAEIKKDWITTSGKVIQSIHPPPQTLELAPRNHSTDSKPLNITPYTELPESKNYQELVKVKDIVPFSKQNNYTNLFLQTLGKQVTRIEEKIENLKPDKKFIDIQPVNIKPPLEIFDFKLKPSSKNEEFLHTIVTKINELKQLKNLNLQVI